MADNIKVGYARVSTKDQNEAAQIKALMEAGVDERYIFIDKESGKNYERDSYNAMLKVIREGDTVFITCLDRLGRNYEETGRQWETITKEIKADIVVLDMPILDTRNKKDLTGTLIADLVLRILNYVSEKERESIRKRQREGIAIAKEEGKYKGRKPVEINKALFEVMLAEVRAGDRTNRSAMARLNLKPNTYYKAIKEFDTKTGRWAD